MYNYLSLYEAVAQLVEQATHEITFYYIGQLKHTSQVKAAMPLVQLQNSFKIIDKKVNLGLLLGLLFPGSSVRIRPASQNRGSSSIG
ncbi:MAG: hypothetical protein QM660_14540 [Dysgonomonas sp.]